MSDFAALASAMFPLSAAKLAPEIRVYAAAKSAVYPVAITNDNYPCVLPYWHGQVVARHILDNPQLVDGKTVVDVGAGCGIAAIAAARCGAETAIALDPDLRCLKFTELNAALNAASVRIMWGTHLNLPDCDLMIAAGVFHESHGADIARIARARPSLIAVSAANLWDMDGFSLISKTILPQTEIHLFASNVLGSDMSIDQHVLGC